MFSKDWKSLKAFSRNEPTCAWHACDVNSTSSKQMLQGAQFPGLHCKPQKAIFRSRQAQQSCYNWLTANYLHELTKPLLTLHTATDHCRPCRVRWQASCKVFHALSEWLRILSSLRPEQLKTRSTSASGCWMRSPHWNPRLHPWCALQMQQLCNIGLTVFFQVRAEVQRTQGNFFLVCIVTLLK